MGGNQFRTSGKDGKLGRRDTNLGQGTERFHNSYRYDYY